LQRAKCKPNERLALDAFFITGARVGGLANATVENLRPEPDSFVLTIELKGAASLTSPWGRSSRTGWSSR
jgi:hypothetical protein